MIPKVIHYCWFGRGKMSPLMKKCMRSWHKYCPDYEIKEWNEDNFDINSTLWTKQAYEAKKYAFVADYVRLKVLYDQGGITVDTDVEIIKPIDTFLVNEAFSGFEKPSAIPTGIIASEKRQTVIKRWLDYYDNRPYLINGKPNMEPNVKFMTEDLRSHGLLMDNCLQIVDGMAIYPQTYFCPISNVDIRENFSENSYCIHYFTSTWRTKKAVKNLAKVKRHQTKWYRALEQLRYLPNKILKVILGETRYNKFKSIVKNGSRLNLNDNDNNTGI